MYVYYYEDVYSLKIQNSICVCIVMMFVSFEYFSLFQ